MTKVYISMDQNMVWFPLRENNAWINVFDMKPKLEVSEDLVKEYEELEVKWTELQRKLELLYRVQEGFKVRMGDGPFPEFKKL